jgi:hypothetical protein
MAQYRLGQYGQALQTLTRTDRVNARRIDGSGSGPVPADLALLALVHHRLGHEDEAGKFKSRLDQRMRDVYWGGRPEKREEAEVLLREVEQRLRGAMP